MSWFDCLSSERSYTKSKVDNCLVDRLVTQVNKLICREKENAEDIRAIKSVMREEFGPGPYLGHASFAASKVSSLECSLIAQRNIITTLVSEKKQLQDSVCALTTRTQTLKDEQIRFDRRLNALERVKTTTEININVNKDTGNVTVEKSE